MARQTIVTIADDIDGSEGAQALTFSLDGRAWETGLAKEKRDKLTRDLAPS